MNFITSIATKYCNGKCIVHITLVRNIKMHVFGELVIIKAVKWVIFNLFP